MIERFAVGRVLPVRVAWLGHRHARHFGALSRTQHDRDRSVDRGQHEARRDDRLCHQGERDERERQPTVAYEKGAPMSHRHQLRQSSGAVTKRYRRAIHAPARAWPDPAVERADHSHSIVHREHKYMILKRKIFFAAAIPSQAPTQSRAVDIIGEFALLFVTHVSGSIATFRATRRICGQLPLSSDPEEAPKKYRHRPRQTGIQITTNAVTRNPTWLPLLAYSPISARRSPVGPISKVPSLRSSEGGPQAQQLRSRAQLMPVAG